MARSKPPAQPQRRQFLKTTAAIGAGLSTPYFFSTPRTLSDEIKSKNDRMQIGVIGAGGMAGGNIEAASQWLDVVSIADADAGHAEQLQQKARRRQSEGPRRLPQGD